MTQRHEHDVVSSLVQWAEAKADIRAMLLTSSRANPQATVDEFSDYDIILAVTDFRRYLESDDWLEDFGRVLTVYKDPIHTEFGLGRFIRVTHYEDGTKIDYTVYPVDLLTRIAKEPELPADLDVGYSVLVDKDKLTEQLKPPTYKAHIPTIPTEKEYQTLVEEFFSETMYVAKHICRDDLMPLKHCLDCMAKQEHLRRMLEWRVELDHNWSVRAGAYGKNLKKYVAPAVWSELESTYVGPGKRENWKALFKTINIFRKVATEVADCLNYSYPHSLDERVVKYLGKTKRF
jgi:aminoglycoside 6-adenylyltransferase